MWANRFLLYQPPLSRDVGFRVGQKTVGLWCLEKLPVDVIGLSIFLLVFVLQIFFIF